MPLLECNFLPKASQQTQLVASEGKVVFMTLRL